MERKEKKKRNHGGRQHQTNGMEGGLKVQHVDGRWSKKDTRAPTRTDKKEGRIEEGNALASIPPSGSFTVQKVTSDRR